jgi:hypothetical protein
MKEWFKKYLGLLASTSAILILFATIVNFEQEWYYGASVEKFFFVGLAFCVGANVIHDILNDRIFTSPLAKNGFIVIIVAITIFFMYKWDVWGETPLEFYKSWEYLFE